jgi:hypothetical protein
MTAGRQVIATHPLKYGVLHTLKNGEPDKAVLVDQIRKLQKSKLNSKASSYWRETLSHNLFREKIGEILK